MRDKNLVSQLIPECKREFKELIQREGIDESVGEVDLLLDDRYSLKQTNTGDGVRRVEKAEESNTCFGGVIMTNSDGLIVCKNTLDARL